MKNSFFYRLAAALAALLLVLLLFSRLSALRAEYDSVNRSAEAYRLSWQSISETKETLQAELAEAESALKEAKLTVTEKEEKKLSLSSEIEALNKEIAELKQKMNIQ